MLGHRGDRPDVGAGSDEVKGSHVSAFFGLSIMLFLVIFFAAALLPMIFYLITLQRALGKCSPYTRTMSPGNVWLQIIPVFGWVWQFFVVGALSSSLAEEYRARRMPVDPQPGRSLGIAMGVVGICAVLPIPILSTFLWIAYLVLWIMYWVKIAGYSRQLDYAPPYAGGYGALPYGGQPYGAQPYGAPPYAVQPYGAPPQAPPPAAPQPYPQPQPPVKTCAACGATLIEDGAFCGSCGQRVV